MTTSMIAPAFRVACGVVCGMALAVLLIAASSVT